MSFTTVTDASARVNRSELAVPGVSPRMFEKALASDADIVFVDLEDAVAPDDKDEARENAIQAFNDLDWRGRGKTPAVRINGLDTHYMYRDVVDVVEQAGRNIDLLIIPKVGTAADVYAVDMLLTQIETARGYEKRIGIEVIVETALGMQNISAIAASSPRLESLTFGIGDYSASIRARTTVIGAFNPDYMILTDGEGDGNERTGHYPDPWHYAISRIVVAARANGLRPIDGPWGNFQDDEGYTASARRARALGCEGKWAIHPRQIPLANEAFTPSAEEIAQAKRILEAMAEAEREGKGAAVLDGRLIDIASIRQADALVKKAELIAAE